MMVEVGRRVPPHKLRELARQVAAPRSTYSADLLDRLVGLTDAALAELEPPADAATVSAALDALGRALHRLSAALEGSSMDDPGQCHAAASAALDIVARLAERAQQEAA